MRDFERRIERLEEHFRLADGCTCQGNGPGLLVVPPGQRRPTIAACPAHGERIMVIELTQLRATPNTPSADVCTGSARPLDRTALYTRLADGRVQVHHAPPARDAGKGSP